MRYTARREARGTDGGYFGGEVSEEGGAQNHFRLVRGFAIVNH